MLATRAQSKDRTNTVRGSDLGTMSTSHTSMGRWCVGATGGVACAQTMKLTIDTDGDIPFMGGKDEVSGGQGFHNAIITIEYGVTGGKGTT